MPQAQKTVQRRTYGTKFGIKKQRNIISKAPSNTARQEKESHLNQKGKNYYLYDFLSRKFIGICKKKKITRFNK